MHDKEVSVFPIKETGKFLKEIVKEASKPLMLWQSDLASLCLGFLICKGRWMIPTSQRVCEVSMKSSARMHISA